MNSIIVRHPGRALMAPYYHPMTFMDEFDAIAREMWNTSTPTLFRGGLFPSFDVYEEKDELVIKAELPGVKKEHVDITLEDGELTIKAEKKEEEVGEGVRFYTRGRYYGTYTRSLSIPFPVKDGEISATFDNGVLEVRLPKAEEAKPKRIELKVD